MTLGVRDDNRRVIPRWRDTITTARLGELGSLDKLGQPSNLDEPDFEASLQDWSKGKSLGLAYEIVAGGLVLNRQAEAIAAANLLLQSDSASPLSKSLATMVLEQARQSQESLLPEEDEFAEQHNRVKIAGLRRALIDYPNNPMLWADLSRCYILLGQLRPSIRAMEHALAFAPNHRFVLRTASRLFIHAKEKERALELLQKSPATPRDPWLLAAQIAASEVAAKNPLYIKRAREMASSSSFNPKDISELSSALGSLDLYSGNAKSARKLIRQSLDQPTENAVAQAVWLTKRLKSFEVKSDISTLDRPFEAQARIAYIKGNWKKSLAGCKLWLLDEPFSSRPAMLGSYIASTVMDDPILSEEFSRRGLVSNPGHVMLTNNWVVSLAYQGRIEEARKHFAEIPNIETEAFTQTTLLATSGLLEYRSGNAERGFELYRNAIEKAGANKPLRALAILHLTKEELRLDPERGKMALRLAEQECRDVADPAAGVLLRRLQALSATENVPPSQAQFSPRSNTYP